MCKIIMNLYKDNCTTEFIVNLVTYGKIISQLHNKINEFHLHFYGFHQ